MSIKVKVIVFLGLVGLIMSCAVGAYSYYDARNQLFKDALKQAEVVSSFAMASRTYAVTTMRPLTQKIVGSQSFHPELMGGFFIARAIADIFAQSQPGYSFKQAAINPVNEKNLADPEERKIIRYFSENPGVKRKKGVIKKKGKSFFYAAQPVIVRKGCLQCHGEKEKAPVGRVERYESGGGYNYPVNSVIATFITYIPIEVALQNVKFRAMGVTALGVLLVFLVIITTWFYLKAKIISPIMELTSVTDEMSLGKGLNARITKKSDDEIGQLYESFDRMRKSVIKLITMVKSSN